jgi:hypothetical protein
MGKSSCCCGATPSKPCLCMKQDVMSCSAKAPMCPCYKALAEKKGAEDDFMGFEYYYLVDSDGNKSNDFPSLEEAQIARSYVPHRNLKIMRRRHEGRNMVGKTTEITEFDPYEEQLKNPNYFKNNYGAESYSADGEFDRHRSRNKRKKCDRPYCTKPIIVNFNGYCSQICESKSKPDWMAAESFSAENKKPFIVYGEYKNGQRIKLGESATAKGAERIVKNKENAGILNFDEYESYGYENANDYYFNEGAYEAESFSADGRFIPVEVMKYDAWFERRYGRKYKNNQSRNLGNSYTILVRDIPIKYFDTAESAENELNTVRTAISVVGGMTPSKIDHPLAKKEMDGYADKNIRGGVNMAESYSAESKRPQGMTSTRFRHKETGEIATRIPISEMRKWEKLDAESLSAEDEDYDAETFEARENKDGSIVLDGREWGNTTALANGNYLFFNKELKWIPNNLKGGSQKFHLVKVHSDAVVRCIDAYENILRNPTFRRRPPHLDGVKHQRFLKNYRQRYSQPKNAETHAYSYAYNDGHSDSRKGDDYRPNLSGSRQEADFKKILKQKAEYSRDSDGRFSSKSAISLTTAAIIGLAGAYLWRGKK